jgi:hypothetical protein
MRYTFIEGHRLQFKVVTMCRVLAVSKAGYDVWRERPPSARAAANEQLVRRCARFTSRAIGRMAVRACIVS